MNDRVVQYPSRYQLVPVAGTTDQFDLVAVPGVVTAAGTDLNKAALLKDATAALFGLSNTAVPDDVFELLWPAAFLPTKNFLNILHLKLQMALKANDIDAWSDLLADAGGINTGASSGYRVAGGKLTYNPQTISQLSGGAANIFGNVVGSVELLAQTFTPAANISQMSIKVKLKKLGSPTDNVKMSIYSTSSNIPSTLLYTANNQISGSSLSTSALTECTFNFDNISLSSGVKYAFVLSRSVAPPTDGTFYYADGTGDAYAGGNQLSYYSGSWHAQGTDMDFLITYPTKAAVVWNAVTPTEALTMMAITADQSVGSGTITWYISDDGTNWTQITALDTLQAVNFDAASVRLKCVLTGNAEVRAVAWGGY